jgi:hypothetical protein
MSKLFTLNNRNEDEEITIQNSNLKRCYYQNFTFSHNKHSLLIDHLEKTHNMKTIIDTLGLLRLFWGIMKINITINPNMSNKDLLKENIAYQCMANDF